MYKQVNKVNVLFKNNNNVITLLYIFFKRAYNNRNMK